MGKEKDVTWCKFLSLKRMLFGNTQILFLMILMVLISHLYESGSQQLVSLAQHRDRGTRMQQCKNHQAAYLQLTNNFCSVPH